MNNPACRRNENETADVIPDEKEKNSGKELMQTCSGVCVVEF